MNKKIATLAGLFVFVFNGGLNGSLSPYSWAQDHGSHQGSHDAKSSHEAKPAHAGAGHWSYEGQTGPEHWGSLDPKFSACATGKEQSPVDLRWSKPGSEGSIQLHYKDAPLKVVDNGHTFQVNFESGSKATIRGHEYELLQMHFHSSSEHTLSGKSFPLELHLVHKNTEGRLAVIGVMFKSGAKNPWIEKIWSNLPQEKNAEKVVASVQFNPTPMIPAQHTHYHYDGSLTTPPCSEGVNWNVLNTPMEASAEQIARFRQSYAGNNRPVQALQGRKPANF